MLRQSFSTVVLVGTMMVAVNSDILAADEPLRIGGYRQLFLDDSVIADQINVRCEFNQVKLLELDTPSQDLGGNF